ncbi:MAG: GIY-YIG nuclease family protein [Deltaproteobacteria bacterium]|nr:GIY-YIG nuclease family protein [Deltaproteobacteria bacterium]
MKWVYYLQSVNHPHQTYIGLTSDLEKRLRDHNHGCSHHTRKYRPWKIVVAMKFADDEKAIAFERYLKSGSGRAFAKRRF